MAKVEIILCLLSSQQSHGSGKKKGFLTFVASVVGQNVSLPLNLHPNILILLHFLILLILNPQNFGKSGRNVIFCAYHQATRWWFQGKKDKIALLSHCDSISWARKVKMRHCCREGWWEGPTPSEWSGRCQEEFVSWAICDHLACFSSFFSLECVPNNWNWRSVVFRTTPLFW